MSDLINVMMVEELKYRLRVIASERRMLEGSIIAIFNEDLWRCKND